MKFDIAKKVALPMLLIALVAGCDTKKDASTEAATPKLEVAAKVNGTELPAIQVSQTLKRMSNNDAEPSDAATVQALRNLVDQEVIAQKAVADKLDQDSTVMQALAVARRQILAEAYMNRKLGTPAEPTDADVTAYFDQHPELFSKRKIYRLQELSIKAEKEKHESIRAQLAAAKTLSDFAAWLKSENFTVKAGQGVKSAEQIPMELLPKLAEMPDGQAIIVNAPDGLLVIVLADSQMQPVTLEEVKPAIVRILQSQARQKAAKAELDALKSVAKIEYLGKYADAGKEDAAPAVEQKPVSDAAQTPAASPAAAPAATPVAPPAAEATTGSKSAADKK